MSGWRLSKTPICLAWILQPIKGKGATFRVRLPLAAPWRRAGRPKHASPAAATQGVTRVLAYLAGRRPRRHGENDADGADRGRPHRRNGGDLATAWNWPASSFDLLISDLGLPDGSGHDLMRQRQRGHKFPGIALSGYGQEEDIQRSREAGFAAHLTKPASREPSWRPSHRLPAANGDGYGLAKVQVSEDMTMSTSLLLVEDDPADAFFLRRTLEEHFQGQYGTTVAATLAEAKLLLAAQALQAVLLDLSLPDSQGLQTIGELAAAAPKSPIVVLTGTADSKIVPEAMHSGAQDYLLKGQSNSATMVRTIRYAIDRKRAEEELRDYQQRELETKKAPELQKPNDVWKPTAIAISISMILLRWATSPWIRTVTSEINLAGARLLNADHNALTGYPFNEYVVQEDMPVFLDLLRTCVGEQCEVTSELRLTAQGGR